jgi:hypothetical protein
MLLIFADGLSQESMLRVLIPYLFRQILQKQIKPHSPLPTRYPFST